MIRAAQSPTPLRTYRYNSRLPRILPGINAAASGCPSRSAAVAGATLARRRPLPRRADLHAGCRTCRALYPPPTRLCMPPCSCPGMSESRPPRRPAAGPFLAAVLAPGPAGRRQRPDYHAPGTRQPASGSACPASAAPPGGCIWKGSPHLRCRAAALAARKTPLPPRLYRPYRLVTAAAAPPSLSVQAIPAALPSPAADPSDTPIGGRASPRRNAVPPARERLDLGVSRP